MRLWAHALFQVLLQVQNDLNNAWYSDTIIPVVSLYWSQILSIQEESSAFHPMEDLESRLNEDPMGQQIVIK